jgi:hypothetical protein
MQAQNRRLLHELGVISGQHASFAGSDILGGVKAETARPLPLKSQAVVTADFGRFKIGPQGMG